MTLARQVDPGAVGWILWDNPVLLIPSSTDQAAKLAATLGVKPGF